MTFVFHSLAEANAGLAVLKEHLAVHPYLDINENLVADREVQWMVVKNFDESIADKACSVHGNKLVLDSMLLISIDQKEKDLDLVVFEDELYFIAKIDG